MKKKFIRRPSLGARLEQHAAGMQAASDQWQYVLGVHSLLVLAMAMAANAICDRGLAYWNFWS